MSTETFSHTHRKLFFIIIFVGILLLFYFIFFFLFQKVFALISFIHDNWNDMKRVSVRIFNGQFKPSRLYYSYKTFLLFSRFSLFVFWVISFLFVWVMIRIIDKVLFWYYPCQQTFTWLGMIVKIICTGFAQIKLTNQVCRF